jgi:hypothetical protein
VRGRALTGGAHTRVEQAQRLCNDARIALYRQGPAPSDDEK